MRKFLMFTFIAILAPVILFAFLGCMQKPDHTPDYGPQVAMEDIQKAVFDNVPPNPLGMKLDQYVSIDLTQVIDTRPPVTLSQKMDKIVAYDPTTNPSEIKWTFLVDTNELNENGVWQNSKQYYDLVYQKDSQKSLSFSQDIRATPSKMTAYTLKALAAEDATKPVKVTYHNLQREDGYMPVPLLVQNRPDCGGVKDCTKGLRFIRISFDRVIWDTEVHGTKTSFRVTHSPDIPTYLVGWGDPEGLSFSNQFQFCMQTWLELSEGQQKQVVPVQQCADMRDFQFGHD